MLCFERRLLDSCACSTCSCCPCASRLEWRAQSIHLPRIGEYSLAYSPRILRILAYSPRIPAYRYLRILAYSRVFLRVFIRVFSRILTYSSAYTVYILQYIRRAFSRIRRVFAACSRVFAAYSRMDTVISVLMSVVSFGFTRSREGFHRCDLRVTNGAFAVSPHAGVYVGVHVGVYVGLFWFQQRPRRLSSVFLLEGGVVKKHRATEVCKCKAARL